MAFLTPQLMNILITEYFSDPTNKGYRKYGNLMSNDGHILFYAPQILALVNNEQNIVVKHCLHDDGVLCEDNNEAHNYIVEKKPSRISELYSGISGAPNILLTEHLVQVYNFFKYLNPTLVNVLRET